jgi:hypothetical protein
MRRRDLFECGILASLGVAASSLVSSRSVEGARDDPKEPGIPPYLSNPIQFQLFSRLNIQGQTELALSRKGPWTPVAVGDTFAGLSVRAVPVKGQERPWTVLEREEFTNGEFIYVDREGVVCRISKPLGRVGTQAPPRIEARSREYWDRLLAADDDILGKRYLADPRDPSLERTCEVLPPLIYPESYVGMKEYQHEVQVSWDGSIGVDKGFFTGNETSELAAALPFALNDREIDRSEGLQIFRALLESYLPIMQYVYQRDAEEIGWEQLILMGRVGGKPALFLRFRLVNYSTQTKVVEFAIHPPLEGKLELGIDGRTISITAPESIPQYGARTSSATVTAPLLSQEPFKERGNLPVWSFELQSEECKDLYFALPGYFESGRLTLEAGEISDAFYEALLEEYRNWQEFFCRGAQFDIPEPTVSEISKGALAKCLVCVDGDEVRGGAVWYEGFWPFCTIYLSQVLVELGYFEEARRYLVYFMKTRIEPSGKFNTGENNDANYQIFDAGYFLKLLACYYWYSRDTSLLAEHIQDIDRVVGFLQANREQSIKEFPPEDPRHGMVRGILNNDLANKPPGFFFTNDAPVWEGLRDYAQMLEEIGAALNEADYVAKGQALARYAKDYYATLRKSFETAKERKGEQLSFVHIHPVLDNPQRPLQCIYLTDEFHRAQRRFHDSPRLAGSDFVTDAERRCIFDFEFNHDQTVLGVRRYVPTILDNFQCYNSAFQKLRLGMVREYLMEYYGTIQALLAPGLWSGFEQVQVVPTDGEKGRRNGYGKYLEGPRLFGFEGAHMTWPIPRLTKQIFAFDEPNGEAVWIGRGIPRHWLTSGRAVEARRLPIRYGKLNIRYVYRPDTRLLTVEIDPLERRMIPELRIGARDPEGGSLRTVRCNPPEVRCKGDAQRELVIVNKVQRPILLQISFE